MNTRQSLLIGAVLSITCVAIGCSSSGNKSSNLPPPPPPAVTISVSPATAAIATGGVTTLQVTLTNDTAVTWTVNDVANGDASVGTISTQNLQGTYTAPAGQTGLVATVTATSVADTSKSASATIYVVPPGTVTATGNSLVASYSITPPSDAQLFVQFGVDTTYGRATSQQLTPQGGGAVSTFVAGMHASTLYHMQGIVQFSDGTQFMDADQTFTTGVLPAGFTSQVSATTTPGMTPQPGIEMLDLIGTGGSPIATDLDGSIIWYYSFTPTPATLIQPIRMLPNGHMLLVLSPNSCDIITGPQPTPNTTNEVREIDLAGNTIKSLNMTDLNTRLATAGFTINALIVHHDVIELPNGHWIFLVNVTRDFTDLPGFPGTTTVLGDVIVDVDANLNPVWIWNTFDHLDVNRHPLSFPDWTHSNALLYTDDGNLLLSIRHQNWIIKIDYKNGQGAGDILWHLGDGGEFTLAGGTDPTDWSYAQHGPAFFSRSSSHVFDLGVMDNGDDRNFPNEENCMVAGFTLCPFTTVPIYHIDEEAMTATIVFHDIPGQYSNFGGDVASLENGNVEIDLCEDTTATVQPSALVSEVTRDANPQVVWKMNVTGQNGYRIFRMPSLYPGVQW
jgi:arylsulfate sulfotransferase